MVFCLRGGGRLALLQRVQHSLTTARGAQGNDRLPAACHRELAKDAQWQVSEFPGPELCFSWHPPPYQGELWLSSSNPELAS